MPSSNSCYSPLCGYSFPHPFPCPPLTVCPLQHSSVNLLIEMIDESALDIFQLLFPINIFEKFQLLAWYARYGSRGNCFAHIHSRQQLKCQIIVFNLITIKYVVLSYKVSPEDIRHWILHSKMQHKPVIQMYKWQNFEERRSSKIGQHIGAVSRASASQCRRPVFHPGQGPCLCVESAHCKHKGFLRVFRCPPIS